MELVKHGAQPTKRQWKDPNESERPSKKLAVIPRDLIEIKEHNVSEKVYKFRILVPNGLCVVVRIRDPEFMEMPVKEFLEYVKEEYNRLVRQAEYSKKRRVNWKSQDLRLRDMNDDVIYSKISFKRFLSNMEHILRLQDGSKEAETYENMWDLTPDTELLRELPAEYTFETALADLIDNSLQAVWSNDREEGRLISVELSEEKISIFDNGPGMDNSEENSIVKWGKMGSSLNRSSRGNGIGGKPPYLKPYFGMFGYGGSIASMHLGRRALVSSKTKESKKVYTLHLQREALLSSSGSESTWETDGGIRNPTDDEASASPYGSFTKVEVFEPRMKGLNPVQLQNRLKDIYFPYIQCDELSKTKTIMPVEFMVNGANLAEIEGGEIAITYLGSCNGPNFCVELKFSQDVPATSGQGTRASQKANARLKFVYFPIVEGKESIEMILEKLKGEEYGITEDYDSFSRVSIRRLGRLLPDSRWRDLPFMKPKQQRGEKGHILKRCCPRVKCFIDTDAGFNPTPSKTDLAHHHMYTTALKNFGDKPLEKDKDVNVNISKDGKQVTLSHLEKQYQEWIFQMHDMYDKEAECGEDQPVVVLGLSKLEKKRLCISSDILRVHNVIPRKGLSWKSGQKIKLLKGAGAGVHKNNVHAILECILLDGFQGDAGGEARLICRPLAVPEEKGCKLTWSDDGKANIDIGDSLSLPVSIIDRGQCVHVDAADWEKQIERQCQKQPSTVDILSASDCLELGIDGALPSDNTVSAGHTLEKVVAVVRPGSFHPTSGSRSLDQKYIVKEDLEMFLQVKYNGGCKSTQNHIYSGYMGPSSRNGFHGLYIFPLDGKCPDIFKKAGVYTFKLSLKASSFGSIERKIKVKALSEVSSWELVAGGKSPPFIARVGSCFPPISIACYDAYKNQIAFPSVPHINIEVRSGQMLVADIHKLKLEISSDNLSLTIKDTLVESNKLDCIRPSYMCTLHVSSKDGDLSTSIPCQVHPGDFKGLKFKPTNLEKKVSPGHTIDELILEMLDGYGNHVSEGLTVSLKVDGFCFMDHLGPIRKVDGHGMIDLGGLLKVTGGYGSKVSLSAFLDEKIIFKKNFETEERELRISSEVQECCMAGSLLENIVFVIVNSEGTVDETFNDDEKSGESHTLIIKSDSTYDSVKYSFRQGCCTVHAISVPQSEGLACFEATHSRYPELCVTFKVNVVPAPNLEPEINLSQHSYGRTLLLQDSPACYTPKIEKENNCSQFSSGSLLLLQDSSALKCVQDLVKEHEDALLQYGTRVGDQEKLLNKLKIERVNLEQDISLLQDSLGLVSFDDPGCGHDKEQTLDLIEKKEETAASVICKNLRGNSERIQKYLKDNILGVVALLGTVQSYGLSRILSEYLGEDHMLAVVSKCYSDVETLEEYDENGNVDTLYALHAIAATTGVSISGRFLVISLEDISPYVGHIGNDPERKLGLPDPSLQSGITPPGFLGYAVNMIDIDVNHLLTRTRAGRGLRETLFYHLFGELQVYETRAYMNKARACIKYGAVSLDGGIMRNCVFSLGNWQSKICFPVISIQGETHFSPNTIETMKRIEEQKLNLSKTLAEIKNNEKFLKTLKKKFQQKKESYAKFIGRMENC